MCILNILYCRYKHIYVSLFCFVFAQVDPIINSLAHWLVYFLTSLNFKKNSLTSFSLVINIIYLAKYFFFWNDGM